MGLFDFFKSNRSTTNNKANIFIQHEPPSFDVNTFSLDLNKLSERDQLILLLISKTSISNPHTLMTRLDRCDFPGNPEPNLVNLVNSKLLYVSQTNGFGHAVKYATTQMGEEFLKNRIDNVKIIDHIKKMSDPDFMLELVQAIFSKMNKT